MATYEKWLGAGLGWITGGPMGGMMGYAMGKSMEKSEGQKESKTAHTSEFEANLLVLSAAIIKADERVTLEELNFVRDFIKDHFTADYLDEKMNILNHCIQRSYDPRKACDDIRISSSLKTRLQIISFLFELAACDKPLTQRESQAVFKLAGWLNVNDVDFNKIKKTHTGAPHDPRYALLGIAVNATYEQIKTAYRKLVLEYHPDRNAHLSAAEQKKVADKFRAIQEAFEKIKGERGFD